MSRHHSFTSPHGREVGMDVTYEPERGDKHASVVLRLTRIGGRGMNVGGA